MIDLVLVLVFVGAVGNLCLSLSVMRLSSDVDTLKEACLELKEEVRSLSKRLDRTQQKIHYIHEKITNAESDLDQKRRSK